MDRFGALGFAVVADIEGRTAMRGAEAGNGVQDGAGIAGADSYPRQDQSSSGWGQSQRRGYAP